MGGVVSSIGNAVGNVVGGVGGLASGVAGAIPGIGPIAGPIVGGLTGGPLGFASSLASQALQGNYGGGGGGGGGGSSSTPMYAQPNISYGTNTYQYGGKPVDVSPYFISGDKGVYNLLPAFGQVNAGTNPSNYRTGLFGVPFGPRTLGKQGAYTPYEAYNDVLSKMAGDQKAIDAFKAAYTPSTPTYSNQFMNRFRPQTGPLADFYKANPSPYGQYVNYNLNQKVPDQTGLTYKKLAQYASKQNNPFFLPYETTTGATPLSFTPSASALAPVNLGDYRNQYYQARQAQRDYLRPPPVTPAPVTPTPVTPTPVTPTPVTPTPVTPTPVTPTPVTPTPVQPGPPGNFVAMNRGGLASLRRS
jgi:hypothetical protein